MPGLCARLAARRADGATDAEALALCDAWMTVIDAYAAWFVELARRAEAFGAQAQATDCRHLAVAAPDSLARAIQLLWVWDAGAGILNHGRLDDDLAPFLKEGGEAEAEALLAEWWRLIAGRGTVFNGRVCLGGRGRRNPQAADRLARLALRVTAGHDAIEPQVSLRLDEDHAPALLDAAFDSQARGRTFPILYWDGQVIPHVAAAHGIDLRCPLIPGLNDDDGHLAGIAALSRAFPVERVEVMPYHRHGAGKAAASDLGNGCMQVIPGSQGGGYSAYDLVADEGAVFEGNIRAGSFDEFRAVPCILAEGGYSLHHAKTIHGSAANTSDRRRCGYTMRYVTTRARFHPVRSHGGRHQLYLARGIDHAGNAYGDPSRPNQAWIDAHGFLIPKGH